jgi:hypothetical protein
MTRARPCSRTANRYRLSISMDARNGAAPQSGQRPSDRAVKKLDRDQPYAFCPDAKERYGNK